MATDKLDPTGNDHNIEQPTEKPKVGPDVYENAQKFNRQIAVYGPPVMIALGRTGELVANSNAVSAVCGMVLGGWGLFGNRFYRQKGDDTNNTYMGQIVGGMQFAAGLMLFTLEATKIFVATNESSPLIQAVNMGAMMLNLTQSTLILMNSYMYGDTVHKNATPDSKLKNI